MKNKIIILFLTIISYSCSDENLVLQEEKLTKEKIIEHLKKRNNNYSFHDESTIFLSKTKTKFPEPIYFDNIEEMDIFLNEIEKVKNEAYSKPIVTDDAPDYSGDGGDKDGYFTRQTYIGGFGVYMNVGFNFAGCSGNNLNSWISGFTLGVSWHHLGGALSTDNQNTRINFTVSGVMNYNLFVEGIGTVFSQNSTFSGYKTCD
ncbi:hypothetical protein KO506_07375 [Polaribacter vadi]|uniref:hypothetical protein n=1 Tax=Polaribacter TaxID=52959 RepID=UPI001C08F179|nr:MULTISPECIES: hypothetical protein [Polaribacter]MBU3011219.1 hypothetical protein [Polaribacter vadi]MDO6741033.1 hypothetical protein [Polaribacter sp. 1_MG-2023]